MLLNKQWAERNAKPFVKKLKSLKMSERDVRALLPSIQIKLEEYNSFDKGKRLLAAEADRHILEAAPGWKIPVDEINFYFSCGMNLSDEIASIIYKKEE
jgi:CRISPR-associated protein Csh1